MKNSIIIQPGDSVAVALNPLSSGDILDADRSVIAEELIPMGHKIALRDIKEGEDVIKYGYPIGRATEPIKKGICVHTHNLKTLLNEKAAYRYMPAEKKERSSYGKHTFYGYLREDGRAAVRNEIWILPLVGCVNGIAELLAKNANERYAGKGVDGVWAFTHQFGCSQMGEDHETTKRLLAALARHPNAGGVLLVGLGCENNTVNEFKKTLGHWDDRRVKFMVCQEAENEIAAGTKLLEELFLYAKTAKREQLPLSKLVVGMKCGGSDGLSGVTANPLAGRITDFLAAEGGSVLLTEVPEMFGAETILMARARNGAVFQKIVDMINDFKDYFIRNGQVVYENPSPGNKDGGITTLEDKSLGCIQKGGTASVNDVIGYADSVKENGLTLLFGPGNDHVSATALAAAGAHILLFTTGRGNPLGAAIPSIKISSNSALFKKKNHWIDFDAGTVAEGEPMQQAAERLIKEVIEVADGKKTKAEEMGYRGIAIFKNGVTL